jgi:hypothetical protein
MANDRGRMDDKKAAGGVRRGRRPPPARMRRAQAIMALVSVVISLLLAEGAVRIAKRRVPFQPDPDLLRSLRPNIDVDVPTRESEENWNSAMAPPPPVHVVGKNPTNNIGFRMAEDVGPKVAGERRVLLLGDSFTEADQVRGDLRFSYLVNEQLKAETAGGPEHWRLLNGGIQNGSPVQYILQLRRWIDTVEPDAVIVALAPNDLSDDGLFEYQYGFDKDADGIPLAPKQRTTLALLQGSYVLRYLNVAVTGTRLGPILFPPESPKTFLTASTDLLCRAPPEAVAAFDRTTGKYLAKLKQMTESKGARFGVFLIQYMWVFDAEPWYVPYFPTLQAQLDESKCTETRGRLYNTFIEGWLRGAGMAFRNPYDALIRAKAENPKRKLWNYVDYHFSPAGHRLIAGELGAFLKEIGIP